MKRRQHLLILVIAGLFAAGSAGCEKSGVKAARETDLTPQQILSLDDQKFLDTAERTEIKQNALAQQALQRSRNAEIQAFATKVNNDLSYALSELNNLMKAKHQTQPAEFAAEVHSEEAVRLDRAPDEAFDREFVSLLTAEGQDAVRIFDNAANTAADRDVRNYANRILPLLRANYDKASEIEKNFAQKSVK
jgi:putative membrane protein